MRIGKGVKSKGEGEQNLRRAGSEVEQGEGLRVDHKRIG